jgi:hypothetical protein
MYGEWCKNEIKRINSMTESELDKELEFLGIKFDRTEFQKKLMETYRKTKKQRN